MPAQPENAPSAGPSRKSPTARLPTSDSGAEPPAWSASMLSTTIGSRITSFIPLSSRRPSRADGGRAEWRTSVRSSTGSVLASAAPRIAAAGAERSEEPPGRERDERGRKQGARAEYEHRQASLLLDLAHVQPDRVAEQHQHEAEGCDHLERSGVEREFHQVEPGGAEGRAEQQEDGDLGKSAPLHQAERSEETRITNPMRASAPVKLS